MKVEIISSGDPLVLIGQISEYRKGERRDCEHEAGLHLLHHAMNLFGIPEADISLNEYGKPYFENTNYPFFSISHSCEYVVCAISNTEIGCDIEKIKKVPNILERELRKIDAVGYNIISNNPLTLQTQRWTVYEAIGKCAGTGIPVKKQTIDNTAWTVNSWIIDEQYLLAVAQKFGKK